VTNGLEKVNIMLINRSLSILMLLTLVAAGCTKGDLPGVGPTPPESSATNMTWKFEKTCKDNYSSSVKLYDRDNGAIWPGATSSWTLKPGESFSETIRCTERHKICFGAANNGNDSLGYWGIGIGNYLGCSDCCRSCGADGDDVIQTLKC
jgi:hypothetical protein